MEKRTVVGRVDVAGRMVKERAWGSSQARIKRQIIGGEGGIW